MAKTLNLEKIKDLRKHLSIPFSKKIILCHGVFDAIHAGHIDYFNSSKKLGDILVVSLTEDNFVNFLPDNITSGQKSPLTHSLI